MKTINSPVVPNGWCYDDFVCATCEVFLTRPPLYYYSLNVDFILKRSFLLRMLQCSCDMLLQFIVAEMFDPFVVMQHNYIP